MMGVLGIVATFKCLADEYRRKHGEDEGLQECHQHFNHINENRERNGEGSKAPANPLV